MAQKILIIDDNPAITRLLNSVLTQAGYGVVSTNDPLDGLNLVGREQPDLVVVDLCMPGVDGWELCRRIRAGHRMPILVLTVLGEPADIERTFLAGADAYMSKPFSIEGFLERVRALLDRGIRKLGSAQDGARISSA
ncbi:MAG: response regulator transcription factor [Chloroflexia bacterium]